MGCRGNGNVMTDSTRTEVPGTRAGNAIRFTCPDCRKETSITFRMPKEFFMEKRDASCSSCRRRFTVLTLEGSRPWKPRVYAAPIVR